MRRRDFIGVLSRSARMWALRILRKHSAQPNRIPKKLHIIWVGDEAKCPSHCIQSWKDKHPDWEVRVWGNLELGALKWRNRKQIEVFRARGQWEGVADLMRYEILHEHGGVYVDADSVCVRPLDDWLLDNRLFAVWESERHRPAIIANGFIGCVPHHPALRAIILAASRMRKLQGEPWELVGPVFFTRMILPFCPLDATILPSVLFLPEHHSDGDVRASSLIYAKHEWGSTRKSYAAPPEISKSKSVN